MRMKKISALIRKENLEYTRDSATLSSLLFLPLVLGVIAPSAILLFAQSPQAKENYLQFSSIAENFFNLVESPYSDSIASVVYIILAKLFAPSFLLIPVIAGATLASSSFAGEKTEKTLEGLFFTPISISELMFGKVVASILPSIIITWVSIIIYTITIGFVGGGLFGSWLILDGTWIFMAIVLVPLIAFLAVSIVVEISRKAKTVKSAQSVAGLLVLPILALVVSQAASAALIGWVGMIIFSTVLFLIDIFLLLRIIKTSPVNYF